MHLLAVATDSGAIEQLKNSPWWQQLIVALVLGGVAYLANHLNENDDNLLLTVVTWLFGIGAAILAYHGIFGSS